jgi:energy-coupling factor transporter ATP-binding protein EcfA2
MVLDLMIGMHAQGRALVIVTHDLQIAALAPRIVRLQDGVIVADGPRETVFAEAIEAARRKKRRGAA